MIFPPTLLCLFVCLCNGAPPDEVNQDIYPSRAKYTEEEDSFIVNELSSFLHGNKGTINKDFWSELAEKHKETRIAGIHGFAYERSDESLRSRFKVLKHTPNLKVKVPDSLIREIKESKLHHPGKGNNRLYTKEEHDFIFQELLKPSCTGMFSLRTAQMIQAEHDKHRLAQKRGFELERKAPGLRSHLTHLKISGKLPKEILEKFSKSQTGASTSQTKPQNQQTNTQAAGRPPDEAWIDEWVEELQNNSEYEFDFGSV